MYTVGLGVEKNYAEAARLFRLSADQGNAAGQFSMGMAYLHGIGLIRNPAEAAKWLRRSAEQEDPGAQFTLGTLYEDGQGVRRDLAEAEKWYSKAAGHGVREAQERLRAMNSLGSKLKGGIKGLFGSLWN